jgi:two-component system nitrogen regulation sensor histidine kinase GlnL
MDRLASVGTLAAGIAHEIKNPLVSIQTFTQLLPERYQDTSFREGFGTVVRDEVSRINKLVQSLLEFARPRPRQIGPVSIHELLDRALTLLDSELHKYEIEVRRVYGDNVPIISGDGEKLFQVFFNLIQNAIQAMDGSERRIVLTTAKTVWNQSPQPADAVLLTIRDSGKGIDAANISHIFDPFFSTKSNGSGLGLSICHAIVEEHGAHIAVESTPGKGTTFSLTLPVKARAAGATAAPTKEPSCRA